ncbi:TIGR02281 family clan AA aspartic protease [Sphingomonas sp. QA11]|uniref:retropepsin-like aspartic protease family protein n=1 Tax=Sphingomonas sp. QA11 TaxID=2950605 RepID=UPI002349F13A|nr:TIGR02281 family clan AA aspartic protease [Sphingomonas sp. QA11]WCM27245.1 TIGR02281 family clan AA aspartic protease [Sphingomonas sp. QA11]
MFPYLGATTPLYLLLAGLIVAAVIGRRLPVMRTLTTLVIWGVLGAVVVMLVRDRGRFDPYLTKVAGLLQTDKQEVVGKEVRIRMADDGHFWIRARIGGVERRMLVDSGATVTALSAQTAAEAGIEVDETPFPIVLRTANGMVNAQAGTIPELRFGTIVARRLAVVVSPAFGDTDVIGMNFLSRLKSWRVEGRTLILEPNHPQPVKPDTA